MAVVRVVAVLVCLVGTYAAFLLLEASRWRPSWIFGVIGYLVVTIAVPYAVYLWTCRRWTRIGAALLAYALSLLLQVPFVPIVILPAVFGV